MAMNLPMNGLHLLTAREFSYNRLNLAMGYRGDSALGLVDVSFLDNGDAREYYFISRHFRV